VEADEDAAERPFAWRAEVRVLLLDVVGAFGNGGCRFLCCAETVAPFPMAVDGGCINSVAMNVRSVSFSARFCKAM